MLLLHVLQREPFLVVLHFPMPYGISLPEKYCQISRGASAHQARRQRGNPFSPLPRPSLCCNNTPEAKGKTGHALACLLFAEHMLAQQENWCHSSLLSAQLARRKESGTSFPAARACALRTASRRVHGL